MSGDPRFLNAVRYARSVECSQAAANTKEQFGASPDYKNVMLDSVADGLDKYQEMAKQVLNSPRVQDGLSEILLDLVFAGFAKRRDDGPAVQE